MTARFAVYFAICGAATLFSSSAAPGWSQFRGPNSSGIAEDADPPIEFGPEKNLIFKVEVGNGASSIIVLGDRLFLTSFENGQLYTLCFSATDGRELWRREAPGDKLETYHLTEGSPA